MMDSFRGLRSQYAEALTSGGYLILLVMALFSPQKSSPILYFFC